MSDSEYRDIRNFLYANAGIDLGPNKRELVISRLHKRLKYFDIHNFSDYFKIIDGCDTVSEKQICINLLTTNETYFFREKNHFDYLKSIILPNHPKNTLFRVWSAASSSGEEAYSIAMELAEYFGDRPWEILGSDICTEVLEKAVIGHYSLFRVEGIPDSYLKKYCLKGKGQYQDSLLIDKSLRDKVIFKKINLNQPLPEVGVFDVVFLRNVLIYFDVEKKKEIISRLYQSIKPGGYLFVGHSESIKSFHRGLQYVSPAIYRKCI